MISSKDSINFIFVILIFFVSSCDNQSDTSNVNELRLDTTKPDVNGFEFKTYSNTEFHFSIEYPSTWLITTDHLLADFIAKKPVNDNVVDPFNETINVLIDSDPSESDIRKAWKNDVNKMYEHRERRRKAEKRAFKFLKTAKEEAPAIFNILAIFDKLKHMLDFIV